MKRSGKYFFVSQGLQKDFLVGKGYVTSKFLQQAFCQRHAKDLSWMVSGNWFLVVTSEGTFLS